MKIKSFFFLFLILSSCSSDNMEQLKIIIDKELPNKVNNGFVIVVAEYDCKSCLQNIIEYNKSIINKNDVFGILYHTKPLDFELKKLITRTKNKIKWHQTSSIELMDILSSVFQNGPYLIEIKDNIIFSIERI